MTGIQCQIVVNVELCSYIYRNCGGVRLARRRSLRTPISYLSWQGGSLLGGVLLARQVCRRGGILPCATGLACQAVAVDIAVFPSVYCGGGGILPLPLVRVGGVQYQQRGGATGGEQSKKQHKKQEQRRDRAGSWLSAGASRVDSLSRSAMAWKGGGGGAGSAGPL